MISEIGLALVRGSASRRADARPTSEIQSQIGSALDLTRIQSNYYELLPRLLHSEVIPSIFYFHPNPPSDDL